MALQKIATAEPQGHTPTLAACFLHFDVSFMLWVLLGALGVYIAESLGLGPSQKALVVAIPILSGSLLRVPLGLLSDRFGGKRVGTVMLLALYGPLFLGWRAGDGLNDLLAIGALLGIAGAYLVLVGGYLGHLDDLLPVPVVPLALIAAGVPAVAAGAGWLVSGREPPAMTRPAFD